MVVRMAIAAVFFAFATMPFADFAQAKTDCAKVCENRCKTSQAKGHVPGPLPARLREES